MQNNRYESNIKWLDPDLPSRRCSIEYFTFLSFVWGSDVTKLGSSGRSSITGQLNHFSPTYSDFIFSLEKIKLRLFKLIHKTQGSTDRWILADAIRELQMMRYPMGTTHPNPFENLWKYSGLPRVCSRILINFEFWSGPWSPASN